MYRFCLKLIVLVITMVMTMGCMEQCEVHNGYGAFLGAEHDDLMGIMDKGFEILFLEPETFDVSDIESVHEKTGAEAFAYVNVGALEDFRDYYDEYVDLTFADYENWPEERWIDVNNSKWKEMIDERLKGEVVGKGFDGVFFDNLDVYGLIGDEKKEMTYRSICEIIEAAYRSNLKVVVNGADEFLTDALSKSKSESGSILDKIYGYNQECIFSDIVDCNKGKFGRQDAQMKAYYQELAKELNKKGVEIFLLEYTKDSSLVCEVEEFCNQRGYHYFCAEDLNLGA